LVAWEFSSFSRKTPRTTPQLAAMNIQNNTVRADSNSPLDTFATYSEIILVITSAAQFIALVIFAFRKRKY
jgi:hypothetical protein